jgi:hypothetical protein
MMILPKKRRKSIVKRNLKKIKVSNQVILLQVSHHPRPVVKKKKKSQIVKR